MTIIEIDSVLTAQPTAPTSPPGGNIENRQPPPPPSKTNGTSQESNSALGVLQEILNEVSDVSNLDKDKQVELTSRLQDAGLLEPGILLDTTV